MLSFSSVTSALAAEERDQIQIPPKCDPIVFPHQPSHFRAAMWKPGSARPQDKKPKSKSGGDRSHDRKPKGGRPDDAPPMKTDGLPPRGEKKAPTKFALSQKTLAMKVGALNRSLPMPRHCSLY
jgi:hypothetical protein